MVPPAPSRLVVFRPDNVGDVVLATPVLRAVRAAFPGAHVTLVASPVGAPLAPLLPWVDDVVAVRLLWQDPFRALPFDPDRERRLVDRLAAGRHDAAVVLTSATQSPHAAGYLCYLAGIPVRVGASREFGGAVLSHTVVVGDDAVHEADRDLAIVGGLGVAPTGRHLELVVPPPAQAAADALLASRAMDDRPLAVVAPGASAPARRYPPARFAAVARGLGAGGFAVAVVGAPGEAAGAPFPPGSSLTGETSLPVLAGVVRRAAVVVANNSGPLHVAEALGRPVVALFAGTDREEQWGPRRAGAVVLRRPTECHPCHAFSCPTDHACLDVTVADVVDAALAVADPVPGPGSAQRGWRRRPATTSTATTSHTVATAAARPAP